MTNLQKCVSICNRNQTCREDINQYILNAPYASIKLLRCPHNMKEIKVRISAKVIVFATNSLQCVKDILNQ